MVVSYPKVFLWFSKPPLPHPSHLDSTVILDFNIPDFLPSVDVCTGSLLSRKKGEVGLMMQ